MVKWITIDKHGRIWGYSEEPFIAAYEIPEIGELEVWDAPESCLVTLMGYDSPPDNWRATLTRLH